MPIDTLAPELLCQIFWHSLPKLHEFSPFHHVHKPPWTISHVCRHWRSLCLSTPTLWNTFGIVHLNRELNLSENLGSLRYRGQLYLHNCRGSEFAVRLETTEESIEVEELCMELLWPLRASWNMFSYYSPEKFPLSRPMSARAWMRQALVTTGAREMRSLRHLEISFEQSSATNTNTCTNITIALLLIFTHAPVLTSLSLRRVFFPLQTSSCAALWSRLRTLRINEVGNDVVDSIFPHLKNLTMLEWTGPQNTRRNASSPQVHELPNVLGISLSYTNLIDIDSILRTPSLRSLDVGILYRSYSFVAPLIIRSGCQLQELCFESIRAERLLEILKHTSTLRHLDVGLEDWVDLEAVLSGLIQPLDANPWTLCPRLESLIIQSGRKASKGRSWEQERVKIFSLIVTLLEARSAPANLQIARFSLAMDPGFQIQAEETQDFIRKMRALEAQGLDLDVEVWLYCDGDEGQEEVDEVIPLFHGTWREPDPGLNTVGYALSTNSILA